VDNLNRKIKHIHYCNHKLKVLLSAMLYIPVFQIYTQTRTTSQWSTWGICSVKSIK